MKFIRYCSHKIEWKNATFGVSLECFTERLKCWLHPFLWKDSRKRTFNFPEETFCVQTDQNLRHSSVPWKNNIERRNTLLNSLLLLQGQLQKKLYISLEGKFHVWVPPGPVSGWDFETVESTLCKPLFKRGPYNFKGKALKVDLRCK